MFIDSCRFTRESLIHLIMLYERPAATELFSLGRYCTIIISTVVTDDRSDSIKVDLSRIFTLFSQFQDRDLGTTNLAYYTEIS